MLPQLVLKLWMKGALTMVDLVAPAGFKEDEAGCFSDVEVGALVPHHFTVHATRA